MFLKSKRMYNKFSQMPEYPMLRHYLELVTELPWNKVFLSFILNLFPILHCIAVKRGENRHPAGSRRPGRRPLCPRLCEEAGVGVPRCEEAEPAVDWTHSMLCRAARGGQDQHCKVYCSHIGQRVSQDISWWVSRLFFQSNPTWSQGAWLTNPTYAVTEEPILAGLLNSFTVFL